MLLVACLSLMIVAGCSRPPSSNTTAQSPAAAIPSGIKTTPPLTSPALAAPDVPVLIQNASQAVSGLKTYFLESSISALKSIQADQSDRFTTSVASRMALDLSSRTMQMSNRTYVKSASGQTTGPLVQTGIYIEKDIIYVQGLFPDQPEKWSRTALNENTWQLQNQLKHLVDLLYPSGVKLLDPETVRRGDQEIACFVLQADPDLKELWNLVMGQPGVQLPSEPPAGYTYTDIVKSYGMKVWISQSTGLPVKADISMSVQVDPSQVASLSGTVSLGINISMSFYDFNQPVTFTVPPEALAEDVPDMKDMQSNPVS